MQHGGQLSRVAKQYNIPKKNWLDLSTGIAPFSYPIPDIPALIWQDLPTINNKLIEAAKSYYQAKYCWPVAGSQQLIEKLPSLWNGLVNLDRKPEIKHVYLPKVGYKEHQQAWLGAGYELHFYQQDLPVNIEPYSVVVVINPNNPLNDSFSVVQLSQLQTLCARQNSLLIVDEAFADIHESTFSLIDYINREKVDNVIILRSFGKFFGLAGIRIGFVCSNKSWCERVKKNIGPWAINGPALYIAELALRDVHWQSQQRHRLVSQSSKQYQLLVRYFPKCNIAANSLFITVFSEDAEILYDLLCQKAVYVRLTDEKNALRFGIANELQLERLSYIMSSIALA